MARADVSSEPMYRAWPRWSPGSPELGGAGLGAILTTGAAMAVITAVLCIPTVARTLGIAPGTSIALMGTYYACMWFNDYVLHPWALREKRGFDAQLIVVPLYNVAFLTAFLLIPNEPRSPLWMGLLLYTATTASWQEIDKSWAFLAFHGLTPLCTIPVFLARGADFGWSLAGPLLCSVVCATGYHLVAMTTSYWRRIRNEQAAAIEELRAKSAELERIALARDLHDSVGATLGLVALYGDLIERYAGDPEELRQLAGTLREATREGLGELRGVLDAMAPERADLATLAENLRRIAARAAAASGASVEVRVQAEGDEKDGQPATTLDGGLRLALVRVFQEALANALRHGQAKSVTASLELQDGQRLTLVISDDGIGFDPGAVRAGARGLANMRQRAEDAGGTLSVSRGDSGGTRIVLELPFARSLPLASQAS